MDVPSNHGSDKSPSAAEEAAARQARIEYLQSLRPGPRRRPAWVRTLIITATVFLLIIAGVVIYWRTAGGGKGTDTASNTAARQGQGNDTQATEPAPAKKYESPTTGIAFEYPEGWKVTEANSQVTVTSPVRQLTDSNGQQIRGRVVMAVSPKGQRLTAFDSGNATAVSDSVKIKYAHPSSIQRAETYVSFAQYAATHRSGALDGIYITGDFGYQKGQAIPKADMVKLDPVVGVTFNACNDDACSNAQPANVQAANWDKQPLAKTVQAMLTSLTVNL